MYKHIQWHPEVSQHVMQGSLDNTPTPSNTPFPPKKI